jgi:hypothetical protein
MAEQWDLLLTLPNLSPPIPTPFQSDGYTICSGEDPILADLAPNPGNKTSLQMLDKFRTARGAEYRPGCFFQTFRLPLVQRTLFALFAMSAQLRRLRRIMPPASRTRMQLNGVFHGRITFSLDPSSQGTADTCRRLGRSEGWTTGSRNSSQQQRSEIQPNSAYSSIVVCLNDCFLLGGGVICERGIAASSCEYSARSKWRFTHRSFPMTV